jgi:hypothetical protein
MKKVFCFLLFVIFSGSLNGGKIETKRAEYYGWGNSWIISNGVVEAIIVPSVARVMQFRLIGEQGPFWENPALSGQPPHPASARWLNFGGDKTWPAPQSAWGSVAGRSWPPPPTFDSLPLLADAAADSIKLTSALDPFFGIRFSRTIRLRETEPVMEITTEYEKVSGRPVKVAIWSITQLQEPEFIRIPTAGLRQKPPFNLQLKEPPPDFKVEEDFLTLSRNPLDNHKIGSYGDSLIWVGKTQMLTIEARRERGGEYPDSGSSTEVYTNADPLRYVELEILGPVKTLKPGEKLKLKVTYTLTRR